MSLIEFARAIKNNEPVPRRKAVEMAGKTVATAAGAHLGSVIPTVPIEEYLGLRPAPINPVAERQVVAGQVVTETESGISLARAQDQIVIVTKIPEATTSPALILNPHQKDQFPYSERPLTPADSELKVDLDVKPQGEFYNLPWWWPFDKDYASHVRQPWLFADNGPLYAYDQAYAEVFGGGRGNLRDKWRGYADKKLSENRLAVGWMGLCHALANMIYFEKKPQAGGRYNQMQRAGVLTLWHAADIPRGMTADDFGINYVLNQEGDWFIANIPVGAGSRWYHLMIARRGDQVLGSHESSDNSTRPFFINSIVEAYRPYPLAPDQDFNELSPQLQALSLVTNNELYEYGSMDREVINHMLRN